MDLLVDLPTENRRLNKTRDGYILVLHPGDVGVLPTDHPLFAVTLVGDAA